MIRIAGLAAVLVAASGAPQDPRVVPVHEEPRHHLQLTTAAAYVLDVQIEAGGTTLFHTHADPIFYVTISTSPVRTQVLGAEWRGAPARPAGDASAAGGTVAPTAGASASAAAVAQSSASARGRGRVASNVSYAEQPVTHRVNNVGEELFRLIGVVNRGPGVPGPGPGADLSRRARRGAAARPAAAPAGADGGAEIDNPWFRAYRFSIEPGATSGKHRHIHPVVVVQVGEGAAAVNSPQGGVAALTVPGMFSYRAAEEEHELRNAGEISVQLIEVEVRR